MASTHTHHPFFNKRLSFYIGFLTILFPFVISAQALKSPILSLKIAVTGNPPFLIHESQYDSGISFELWDAVAKAEHWDYSTISYGSTADALHALNMGEVDLVVGPISITSDRMKQMDFSQPYYYSGQSIMSRLDEPSLWDRISPFISLRLLIAVCLFLFILGIVGTLVWLAERNKSPEQFPKDIPSGIANGMWLAIVTMSTTGYGDKAPITFWGRVIMGCWMVISIIFATSMVAGIASTLTLTGMGNSIISEANQLAGKKVATPSYPVVASFIQATRAKAIPTNSLEEAYDLLKNKKVDAILFDRPQLLYFQKQHPSEQIQVGRSVYESTGYGFAFPMKSPLVKIVNIQMLALHEQGVVKDIVHQWIDDANKQ